MLSCVVRQGGCVVLSSAPQQIRRKQKKKRGRETGHFRLAQWVAVGSGGALANNGRGTPAATHIEIS